MPFEDIDVIDRIGSGDAYVAGALFGMLKYGDIQQAVDFGNAMSAVKNTIVGDMPASAPLRELSPLTNTTMATANKAGAVIIAPAKKAVKSVLFAGQTVHGFLLESWVEVNPVVGKDLTILGLVGDTSRIDDSWIEANRNVLLNRFCLLVRQFMASSWNLFKWFDSIIARLVPLSRGFGNGFSFLLSHRMQASGPARPRSIFRRILAMIVIMKRGTPQKEIDKLSEALIAKGVDIRAGTRLERSAPQEVRARLLDLGRNSADLLLALNRTGNDRRMADVS